MIEIKHISFDLWMTLIKSNPTFKSERANYFFQHHNLTSKTIEQISEIIREVDLMCNAINEITGKNISSEEMYLMVLHRINGHVKNYDLHKIQTIYLEINELFESYAPSVYDSSTISTLVYLKENQKSMSILSNTAFIKGSALVKLLKKLNLADFFDFQFFSDEFELSKPNFQFFNQTYETINRKMKVLKSEILHVGDNFNADILGANNFGYHSFLINSNDKSIQELRKL